MDPQPCIVRYWVMREMFAIPHAPTEKRFYNRETMGYNDFMIGWAHWIKKGVNYLSLIEGTFSEFHNVTRYLFLKCKISCALLLHPLCTHTWSFTHYTCSPVFTRTRACTCQTVGKCKPIFLFLFISIYLFRYLPIYNLDIYLFVYLDIYLSIYLDIYIFMDLSFLSIIATYLSFHLVSF